MDDGEALSAADVVMELIREKLDKVPSLPSDYRIYRVPESLVKEKPEAYVPSRVSIGPFYHGHRHLQPMEARKLRYFKKFLNRQPEATLSNYIKVVRDLEERAYQCYPDGLKFERNNFVMMMVVDGCFILELLHLDENETTSSDGKWSNLATLDLILLENQLPIFVLEALYRVFINGRVNDSFHRVAATTATAATIATATAAVVVAADDHTIRTQLYGLICKYFVPNILRSLLRKEYIINYSTRDHIQELKPEDVDRPKHLLDFVRRFLLPPPPPKNSLEQPKETYDGQRKNKGELEKASVKFEKNKKVTSLLDIKFDKKGVLTIPSIAIDDGTEIILRNLVAYELYTEDHSYITEYANFMDGLIDSREDVELLQDNGIIVTISDPSEVAQLFNGLLKQVRVFVRDTISIRLEVEEYYNIRCHKWKASLMLNYFSSPWSFISLVAAIILLALTIIQTIYTVLSYHS
ncbi:UPF0481 protein At3g47200-like [Macadamia integrifolia]|uniref:UPF0481 protein At3g47200-like n=1 Tax=Macadamia integrifolia TaxID=60698 RepID=UPI001C4E4C76|nr:UPF0481 protein At3g47200-like [Macadamia integrifolia]